MSLKNRQKNLLLNRIYRIIFSFIEKIRNTLVLIHLRSKYPSISIDGNNAIGKSCQIRCTDTSKLIITNSVISQGCMIVADHGGKIEITDSFIGPYCVIVARNNITINKNCQIAEMVTIRDQNHNFGQKGKTITEQGFSTAPIVIEENVWLGAKVTVTAGSTIGKNTVIGAHALVRGTLDSDAVYGGIPAKLLKKF